MSMQQQTQTITTTTTTKTSPALRTDQENRPNEAPEAPKVAAPVMVEVPQGHWEKVETEANANVENGGGWIKSMEKTEFEWRLVPDEKRDAEEKEHARKIERERSKAVRAEAYWKEHPNSVAELAKKLDETISKQFDEERVAWEAEASRRESGVQMLLTPLTAIEALNTCAKTYVAHDKRTDATVIQQVLRSGVLTAPSEIVVPMSSLESQKFIVGGAASNPSEIHDVYLSHEQLVFSRRACAPGSDEDVTGDGVAIDCKHVGKNFSYVLPVEDAAGSKSSAKRFSEKDGVKTVLPHLTQLDPRLMVLRKDGTNKISMRCGDVVFLIKDKYPYRFEIKGARCCDKSAQCDNKSAQCDKSAQCSGDKKCAK